jgi:hypothetical protein
VAQGDVPLAVEIGGAGLPLAVKRKGIRSADVIWMLAMVSSGAVRRIGSCMMLQSPEAYDGSCIAAAVQRSAIAIAELRQREAELASPTSSRNMMGTVRRVCHNAKRWRDAIDPPESASPTINLFRTEFLRWTL